MPVNSNILKLKQKLKAWNRAFEGLPPPQRRLGLAGAGLLLVLLIYVAVVSPLMSLENSWAQELARKQQLLSRYQTLQASQDRVAKAHQVLKAALTQMEDQFLAGGNAAVAAADLQEILKSLTGSHGVQLTSTKILQPGESGPYIEVPIQVQMAGTIDQLLTILYSLEHHEKLLFIPDMEINAPRWMARGKQAGLLQVNLVVAGVIKKGANN